MNTSKPFGTISYNTIDYLKNKLDSFLSAGTIAFYAFIHHLPDLDDKKEHIHLHIVPSRRINTEEFLKHFEEPDPNNDKPLGCIMAKNSKWGDWFWYGLHNPDYLDAKNLVRNVRYTHEQYVVSDELTFLNLVSENPLLEVIASCKSVYYIQKQLESGVTEESLLRDGHITINNYNQFKSICKDMSHRHSLERDYQIMLNELNEKIEKLNEEVIFYRYILRQNNIDEKKYINILKK